MFKFYSVWVVAYGCLIIWNTYCTGTALSDPVTHVISYGYFYIIFWLVNTKTSSCIQDDINNFRFKLSAVLYNSTLNIVRVLQDDAQDNEANNDLDDRWCQNARWFGVDIVRYNNTDKPDRPILHAIRTCILVNDDLESLE